MTDPVNVRWPAHQRVVSGGGQPPGSSLSHRAQAADDYAFLTVQRVCKPAPGLQETLAAPGSTGR